MACFFGVDIGGTSIKVALCAEDGQILRHSFFHTKASSRSADEILEEIACLCEELAAAQGLKIEEVAALGVGSPGTVNPQRGELIFAGNLPFHNFPLESKMKERLGVPAFLCNDANVAALAENELGAGVGCEDSLTVTIGTGIGSGVIIGGKIYSGFNGAGCECGHMVIHRGGEPCSCGRRGCMEAYCSAPALIRRSSEAIAAHPDCLMAKKVQAEGKIGGRTAFDARDEGCEIARALIDAYLDDLAIGLANLANCFFPEVIILGGGISQQGESFRAELEKRFKKLIFNTEGLPSTELRLALLGNQAGMIGAALMARNALDEN